MDPLKICKLSSDLLVLYRTICPKRTKSRFRFVSLLRFTFLIFVFLLIGCASLLPEERRVYPNNPLTLPKDMDIHQWMESKKNQYQDRLWSRQIGEGEYKFSYFRKEFTRIGSYTVCTALMRSVNIKQIEIYNLIFSVNYADYNKRFIGKGGDLGPMSEKERTEILLPCIEEFLESPQTKE